MKISELSPDLRPPSGEPPQSLRLILDELESSTKEAESLSSASSSDDPSSLEKLAARLRRFLSRLTSYCSSSTNAVGSLLPEPTKLQLWKLSYRLWNACVDLSNAANLWSSAAGGTDESRQGRKTHLAELRQIAADLLLVAGNPAGVPSGAFKTASFFHKTGLMWHDLRRFDLAASCFERATDLTSSSQIDGGLPQASGEEERRLLLDLNLARARTAWEVTDRNLAIALLSRSKNLIFGSPAAFRALAEQYLQFGKIELAKRSSDLGLDASKLLSEALDLCEKGIAAARGRLGCGGGSRTETQDLESLKARILRFLAAERLHAEDYEGVLRCVKLLRASPATSGEEHPSVAYVAMKAWLGAGRIAEAEWELKGMMTNKQVPENACVSAAETYLAAAGTEAVMPVLLALVSRCRAGATAALRLVQKMAEGGSAGRARVVAELTADERVVALFEGTAAAKQRSAMHALLWNCGAEHFRSKDYEISVEMFEKSMLYVPRNEENRSRRSNCFRVLCLCHLALGQLDRAQEFIEEANKLDPNVKCAFLKFKIYLQKKDEEEAINQMQAMVGCADFNPEFLTLCTHEAIACQSLPTAIASLSFLLTLYCPGQQMPMPEVVVLRNLITLLLKEETYVDILKYIRRARCRMNEIGVESFFGTGAVGKRELEWFAGSSWNMGLKTAKEKKFELCSEFFELVSDFYSLMGEKSDQNQNMLSKSLVLSAGAMLNIEEQKKVPMSDSDLKKAMEMLGKAGKILPSLSSSVQGFGEQQIDISNLLFLHTYCSYQLMNRFHDNENSQQIQLVKRFVSSKACTPQHLLQLGLAACGQWPNPEVAEFAFSNCLSALLASTCPDYHLISIALRRLACLAGFRETGGGENDEAYGVYRRAYQIIVGLKEGEYPIEEGKWLAMSAWNKAGLAVHLQKVSVAKRWMKTGLDLARHLKGMEKYIGAMEESIANFEKLFGGSGVVDEEGGEVGSVSQPVLL